MGRNNVLELYLSRIKDDASSGNYNIMTLAQKYGVNRHTISAFLKKNNILIDKSNISKFILDVDVDRIIDMFEDNISIAKIALTIGRDRSVVEKRLIERGYSDNIKHITMKYSGIESCYYKLYRKYQTSAKERNHTFNLTEEEFFHLLQQPCHYCGKEPYQIVTNNYNSTTYNGIDRVNNGVGYEIENVVSCCGVCNVMKQSLTEEEFFSHIKQIIANCNC